MKRNLIILFALLIISCTESTKNPSGLNPENMTEEELYAYYGLEAPSDVYEFIYRQIKEENNFQEICVEKTVSPFIRVIMKVDSSKVSDVFAKFSDFSPALDSLIVNSLLDKEVNFSFMEGQSNAYDFRIDVSKMCRGGDFSPTPPKDSTLNTMPNLNKTLKETNEILNETILND